MCVYHKPHHALCLTSRHHLSLCGMVAVVFQTQWSVTHSLRVAAFSHRNKLGEPVLVDVDLKTKLCKHGETSSTIRTWLQLEAQARAADKSPPFRGISTCDCTSTLGLQNHTDTGPVQPPACVYDVLAKSKAQQMTVQGEKDPVYRLGERDAFLSVDGAVFCGAHFNMMATMATLFSGLEKIIKRRDMSSRTNTVYEGRQTQRN